ncbi:MAG: MucBP domain-containing protein [Bacilli bacterium]|nr:MucBP domain-containing protein [Bacilli bacterium]
MKKLKNIGQLFMTLVMLLTSVFSNAFVVYADTNPDAGKVTATKTAERIGDETSRSAKVKITVSGTPYTLTTQKEREIVLVLDASGSMTNGISGSNKNRIETLKDAAVNFIDNLLTEENAGKIKIGVVWYAEKSNTLASDACQLSDDAQTLKNCVSNKRASGGTNVQLGISIAKNLFTTADNEKSLIVLSDGEPTFYNDKNGVEHGNGRVDAHENMYAYDFVATRNYQNNKGQWVSDGYIEYYDYNSKEKYTCEYVGYKRDWNGTTYESVTCPEGFNMKPSEAAQKEVSSFNGKIYSIGFGITSKDEWGNTVTNTAAESFLKSIVKNGGRYFDASDSAKLNEAFAAVSKDIEVVAKDLTIKDIVPSTFTVDENDLKQRYGNNVTITKDENTKETIITYKFAELSSKKPEELTFTVTANEDYYGSMYTNNGAAVTGTAADGNKFYENVDGKINENLIDPVAPIASRTKDDKYETKTNEELVVNTNDGIKSNDYKGKQEDEAKSVLDEIVIVNNTKFGSLELNQDGSLKYNPNNNFRGDDNFTYYIKTTITDKDGNKTYAKSNTSTVTITVNGVETSYIVNYLEKGTNKKVADSKTISKNANNGDLYIGDEVTEYALTLNNYNLVGNSQESITLAKEGNVINFYYELKDSKIVVHYVEKGTNKTLEPDKEFTGKVTETKVINAIDIKDYVVVGSKVQDAVFDLTTNEYTFYYEKAESAGAVAHHYIIDNNGNKTTDKLFNDDTASGKIGKNFSFSPKTEGLGDYEFVESEGTTSGALTSEKQEATFYYQLKMTNVTVRYVSIKDGNVIDLINPVKDTGRINDDYTAYAKDETDNKVFANYNLESATEQTIKLKSSDNTITFIYTLKDSKIVVHYVEKGTNKTLAPDKEFTGKVTDKFEISAINITKYTAVDTTSYNGEYTPETKEYTFYYEKNESAGAIAHHYIIDENGNKTTDKLFEDDTISGKLDKEYLFSAKTDLGAYEFVESTGNTSGVLTEEVQEATFYYKLRDAKVIVHHYEDGTTIKIAEDETINGKVSKDYTTKEADVYGYVLVSTPENASGMFTDEVTEVIYYYKKDMGKVITKYVDEDGKVLLEETTTNGQVGTDYQTSPATITDYELINTIGEVKGKYTKEDIIVTYVYQFVMGEGGDDTNVEPDIPYTGIESDSYLLEYSLMGTSALGLILLAILKKKFN